FLSACSLSLVNCSCFLLFEFCSFLISSLRLFNAVIDSVVSFFNKSNFFFFFFFNFFCSFFFFLYIYIFLFYFFIISLFFFVFYFFCFFLFLFCSFFISSLLLFNAVIDSVVSFFNKSNFSLLVSLNCSSSCSFSLYK